MPLYDFICKACGAVFEALSGTDEQVRCDKCGSEDVKRGLSAPGRVGVKSGGGALQCGRETTCCGQKEPCGKSGCHG